jgi:hypothetical protein
MTELYAGSYNLNPVRGETSTSDSVEVEIKEIRSRIEGEGYLLSLAERLGGLEVEVQQRVAAERIVDNRLINREGQSEIYLDLDPAGSNYPSPRSHD